MKVAGRVRLSVPLRGGLVCCVYQSEVGLMLNGASLGSELIFCGLTF